MLTFKDDFILLLLLANDFIRRSHE